MNVPKYSLKIVVIGESGVGKTSITRRVCDGVFEPNFTPTVGVEFKTIEREYNGQLVKLQLWDTAGQERFRSISKAYFRNAVGALVVFDITNHQSFENVSSWIQDFEVLGCPGAEMLLVGNKTDLEEDRTVSEQEIQHFASSHNIDYLQTSSYDGHNIEETFIRLMNNIMIRVLSGDFTIPNIQAQTPPVPIMTPTASAAPESKSCC